MRGLLNRYAAWLHTQWPAGVVEPLPEVRADGSTQVPGLFIAGDLTGIPLLKFALDSGARIARRIGDSATRLGFRVRRQTVEIAGLCPACVPRPGGN